MANGSRSGPATPCRPEPGEWHWHGAGPGTFMTHLAVQEADESGRTSEFGEHVTDDEYRA